MALADYINNKPTIETDRLIVRPMIAADIPALKEWMPDKSIYTYWGKGPSKAEKNPEMLFEKESKPKKKKLSALDFYKENDNRVKLEELIRSDDPECKVWITENDYYDESITITECRVNA